MPNDNTEVEKLKTLVRVFAADLDTSTMPYINEGLRGTATLTQMTDADRAAGKPGVTIGSTAFDVGKASTLRLEGIALKRGGNYMASAENSIESFRLDGHYDLVNLRNLWKSALCGGDAKGALDLIQKAISTYERYDVARQYEKLPYPPHDDFTDVVEALSTEISCKSRLRDFSGNPDYVLPRPYQEIIADL